ncbi:hypothetical protein PF005_g10754 [Phytophthora fragariae]|uniref:Uncharacterized protein n=2 Tax=Phytophthora fragariae TaxID=53985 RepID=A0A6A3L662_9STRA|nr:hypothetical protein PF011_g9464 [Phytophthora fragariae]KAE9212060.1 hypothetical protein PF005_g10754 [Phytophthora fragariae]
MSAKRVNANLAALKFSGKEGDFAGWKDRIIVHLRARSDQRNVEELQANRLKPVVRYEASLQDLPVVAKPTEKSSDKERAGYDLQLAFVAQQESYIKDLLSLTMPPEYKMDKKVHEPVHAIWHPIEKRFGLNTVAGVVGLIKRFEAAVNDDLKSMSQLFARLKALKDEANRNNGDALQTGVISSNLMMLKILGVLPNHMWGQAINLTPAEFTPDRVEAKLCAIFGSKSKAKIVALDRGMPVNHVQASAGAAKPKKSALGNRKATAQPWSGPDMHHNLGIMKCHYCAGAHNDMGNIGPHKKFDCLKMRVDRAVGVYRRDIWSRPSSMARKVAYDPTPKMKGKGKDKAPTRREVPLEECLPAKVAVDACKAVQETPVSPTGYMSPPPSNVQLPLTPGRGATLFDDLDEPMDSVVNAVGVDAEKTVTATEEQPDSDIDMDATLQEGSKHSIAETAKQFADMMKELEKKARGADTA